MTTEEQRARWKRLAQEYIDLRFKGSAKPELTQWGPDGFYLRDHASKRTAFVTSGEVRKNEWPNWREKKSDTQGAGIASTTTRTVPAKKKMGRRAKNKAKKQKAKRK